MRKWLLYGCLFMASVAKAQVHGELQQFLSLRNNSWGDGDSSLFAKQAVKKSSLSIQAGWQQINGPQQGRNSLFFTSKAGRHAYATLEGHLTAGKWKFHFQPMILMHQPDTMAEKQLILPTDNWIGYWIRYMKWINKLDDRNHAQTGNQSRFLPGNTHLSFDGKRLRAIMGYRQVHWGPSKGDALILGKNSPAFLQAAIGTGEKGIAVLKGHIKWELLAGLLASPQFAYDDNGFKEAGASIVLPKREQQRFVNGFDINYTRGKKAAFTVGLNHLSMFYPDKEKRVHRYFPLLSYPFSLKAPLENEPASMGSMYVKLKVPADHLEIWAEYGYADRGIFPLSPLLQDTAKYGYTFGVSKLKPIGAKKFIELFSQVGYLQANTLYQAGAANSWYTHATIRQGFSNDGMVLGNGIGPGGTAAYFAISLLTPKNAVGTFFERRMRNKDFFYSTFYRGAGLPGPFERQWMDLRWGGYISFLTGGKLRHHINVTWIKSYAHQWQIKPVAAGFYKDYAIDKTGFRVSYELRLQDLL